jgi:hypothetical protein
MNGDVCDGDGYEERKINFILTDLMLIFFRTQSNFHKYTTMVDPKTVMSTDITKSCWKTLALLVYT